MKKALLITGALLALTAGSALAQGGSHGINLSWTDCGATGVANKTFSCLNNTGSDVLIGSYEAPCGLDSLNGQEIVLDMQTSGATLPQWWYIKNTGYCRATAASISFDFTGTWANCADYWMGQALGDFGVFAQYGGLNRMRIKGVCAIASVAAGPWPSKIETYSFRLTINHTKTTSGTGCAGCLDAACIVFNSLRLTQNPGPYHPADEFCLAGYGNAKVMTTPKVRNYVSWQGGIAGCGNPVTPTKNATWGQVKSLYR